LCPAFRTEKRRSAGHSLSLFRQEVELAEAETFDRAANAASGAARAGARGGFLLIVLLPVVFAVVAAFILLRVAFLALRAVFTVALALASLTRS
jgi:hypothetical protein